MNIKGSSEPRHPRQEHVSHMVPSQDANQASKSIFHVHISEEYSSHVSHALNIAGFLFMQSKSFKYAKESLLSNSKAIFKVNMLRQCARDVLKDSDDDLLVCLLFH